MTWFKVDDGIHSHPKFLDVSLAAVGLWTMCGAWCSAYLTDGQITRRQVQRLGRIRRLRAAVGHVAERAATGADSAEDHKGRGTVVETLGQVRARGFLTDGVQAVFTHRGFDALNAR